MKTLSNIYLNIVSKGNAFRPILLLCMRLFWGGSLMFAGWGKLDDIESVSHFFHTLNIPLPTLQAYAVGYIECVGGFCLLIGLAARVVSIPLFFVMMGAFYYAHTDELFNIWSNPQNFIAQTPFCYLLTTLIIFAFGPGKISVDRFILPDREG